MTGLLLAVTLSLAQGQLPQDTLTLDSVTMIGVAVPARAIQIEGDFNRNGEVTAADIITLVRHVFQAVPLPEGGLVGISGTEAPFRLTDTTAYLFIPFYGVRP